MTGACTYGIILIIFHWVQNGHPSFIHGSCGFTCGTGKFGVFVVNQ
jgi:hypothetical protein